MNMRKRLLPVAVFVGFLALAGTAAAQMGRVAGKVVDSAGKPVPGVLVTVTARDMPKLTLTKTTNKRGKFTVSHTDVAHTFLYRLEKDGYKTVVVEIRPSTGGTMSKTFVLKEAKVAVPAAGGSDGGQPVTASSRAVRIYNQGVSAQQAGDLAAAGRLYRQAAEIDPEFAAPHTALAGVLEIQADHAAAAAEAEKALALDAGDARALQLRYDAYRALGNAEKTEEAAEALRKVGDAGKAAKRVYNEGAEAFNDGRIGEAVSKLEQAIQLDPDLVPAYVALAQVSLRQGSPARAGEMAAAALVRDPDNAKAGKLAFEAARLQADPAAVAAALDRLGPDGAAWAAPGAVDLASSLYDAGKIEGAGTILAKVLELAPDLPRAHFLLGLVRFNGGDAAAAKRHLERFLELAPDSRDAATATEILKYIKE